MLERYKFTISIKFALMIGASMPQPGGKKVKISILNYRICPQDIGNGNLVSYNSLMYLCQLCI